jgi:ATPase family associated with various cellular activities (AAA)
MSDERAAAYPDNDAFLADLRRFGELLIECAEHTAEALKDAWQGIVERMAATLEAQIFVPWIHVAAMFRLGAADQRLLLLALLSECDDGYAARLRKLSRAADESREGDSEPEPRELARDAVPLAAVGRIVGDMRLNLLPDAPLRRAYLIETADAGLLGMTGSYRLARPLAPYLLGLTAPQLHMEDVILPDIRADCRLQDHLVDDETKRQLARFVDVCCARGTLSQSILLNLQSSDAALGESLCAATFAELDYACARFDARKLRRWYEASGANRTSLRRNLNMLCRDAVLGNQVLMLSNSQWLVGEGHDEPRDDLLDDVLHVMFSMQRYVAVLNGPTRSLAESVYRFDERAILPLRLNVDAPNAELRRLAWLKHADSFDLTLDAALLDRLVDGYRFGEDRIAMVLKDAAARALLQDRSASPAELVLEACRAEAQAQQPGVAKELRLPHRLSDLVAPEHTIDMVVDLLNQMRYRPKVVEEWGFAGKYAGSRNLSALFYGPSGTGKTMTASIVANELGLSLYRVDLASVLSKYIGETEQHLAQLFDCSEAMNVVLFFDEAEGLFAKRTETRDAHDRYANLQIGYLLQRIETYAGLVILSTNLLNNVDKAFMRRFRFVIEFPFPTHSQRKTLWQQAFPPGAPIGDDVDFDLIAQKAVLAGGSIHNVALSSAFRAAAEDVPVSMRHIVKSIEREYMKLGKVFAAAEFDGARSDQR